MTKKHVISMMVLVTMVGCASVTPTRYYTLDMTPSGKVTPSGALHVDRVNLSQALSRKEILIKKSPTEVEYYAADQWVAGLDQLVAQKLNAEFGHAVSSDQTIISLSIDVQAFEQIDTEEGADAYLQIIVDALQNNRERTTFTEVFEIRTTLTSQKPVDVVQALSDGLEEVAVKIAEKRQSN
jgi:uncharacterized lipoprotein YmbA